MHPVLVGAGIAAVFWSLVQGFVPLAIETFVSVPKDDPGERLNKITPKKIVFTKLSIVVLAAILVTTVVGMVFQNI